MKTTSETAHPPRFSIDTAAVVAKRLFGVRGTLRPLPSERDQNFLVDGAGGRHVLKIANPAEPDAVLEAECQVMGLLSDRLGGLIPRPAPALDGSLVAEAEDGEGVPHRIRLITFLPGKTLAETRPHSPQLLRDLGAVLGRVDRALKGFSHPGLQRRLKWDLRRAAWIGDHLALIPDERREIVEAILDRFHDRVLPGFAGLRHWAIHNDANDHNLLVESRGLDGQRISGLIDFGDMIDGPIVCELAVGAAYAMLGKSDPAGAAAEVAGGFHSQLALTEPEIDGLWDVIQTRLAVSVVNSAWQREIHPENPYLQVTDRAAWELLARMRRMGNEPAISRLRQACGLEPCRRAVGVKRWLGAKGDFGPLLETDLREAPAVLLDLSAGSLELGNVPDFTDAERFSRRLFERIRSAGAKAGIGRWNEARLLYAGSGFAEPQSGERRTVHLGVDLFVEPGERVLAPLDGTVHSFQDNRLPLDYGPTVILEHEPEPDVRFWTLYGHLRRSSLSKLREGQVIARGAEVGRIGELEENGGWPPHLHFQIICDLMGRRGDFPGVAAPCQREAWLSLCPDPSPLLGIAAAAEEGDQDLAPRRIVEIRGRRLGKSLSLSYRSPLKIVRGFGCSLFDHEGRAYLDCVNNVAHVGHCHPRVVEAGNRQASVLNTNTRYLHDRLALYSERLCALFPEPLDVCFLVCSGSEANELALRLARAKTGGRHVLVLEGGYHGNTGGLVEVSSYKFDGPGGAGAPPHVLKAPLPDCYRGRHRDPVTAGARFAAEVAALADSLRSRGQVPAAFLYESIAGCGGQVVPPPGYLAEAHRAVRTAGGVCIADEVQVGFGRVGDHWWGFELQGVVPDIVTLGKPIGNGHPMGAVITTREIADAFANGMEYFNTFGGNPVSCAIGLAVLEVIEDEGLRENARRVGSQLKRGLLEVQSRRPLIGEVRGVGLFLGVELVRDRRTLEPAAAETAYVVERMREMGILLSVDGPLHNVIKIKPPLVFSESDAERVAEALDEVLGEDFCQVEQ